jgi:hypothetical protein
VDVEAELCQIAADSGVPVEELRARWQAMGETLPERPTTVQEVVDGALGADVVALTVEAVTGDLDNSPGPVGILGTVPPPPPGTGHGVPPDCCPGEPFRDDPDGLHTLDCPVYLANMAAWEAFARSRTAQPGEVTRYGAMPGGILAYTEGAPAVDVEALKQSFLAAQSGPVQVLPPDADVVEVLAQWDGWQCFRCGRRYRVHGPHGAPERCAGRLEPIRFTVTRRPA